MERGRARERDIHVNARINYKRIYIYIYIFVCMYVIQIGSNYSRVILWELPCGALYSYVSSVVVFGSSSVRFM